MTNNRENFEQNLTENNEIPKLITKIKELEGENSQLKEKNSLLKSDINALEYDIETMKNKTEKFSAIMKEFLATGTDKIDEFENDIYDE